MLKETQRPSTKEEVVSQDPQWELIERVSTSTALKNSPRLRKLFHYLCEQALATSPTVISEQQVAVDVFNRAPGYNSDGDTIVRTQVSHLRKRLLQYFLSEGRDEPVTIEIPAGSYVPLFQPQKEHIRELKEVRHEGPIPVPVPAPAAPRFKAVHSLWAVAVVLIFVCAWLGWQNARLRTERAMSAAPAPYLEHLWRQWFDNGRQSTIVTSDANAMLLSDFMEEPITLDEYQSHDYPDGLLQKWVKDSATRQVLKRFMSTYFTGSQDGFAVARFTGMGDRFRASASVVYARDFRSHPPSASPANNLILLGHRKANPWVQLFDDRLNFRYEWNRESRKGLLRNTNPKSGESETYEWNVPYNTTYATVAYVPARGATVLLIGGSDMTAVDAASKFLCDEEAVHQLHTALGIDTAQQVPYFELLLAARRARNVAYDPQIISVRLLGRATRDQP